ncbi:MAG TPA: hypothetical protein VIJ24_04485 [Verrucomicrobiae bacterium]
MKVTNFNSILSGDVMRGAWCVKYSARISGSRTTHHAPRFFTEVVHA